ncbi:MAG: hypothetical protein ACTIJ6_02800 [Leucobacter sp.]
MRYVLAIAALAISGVLLLLGIGQRTFLAGPTEIVHSMKFDEGVNYAVIESDELLKIPGQANILMRGDASFVAVAKTRDIDGWLAPFDRAQVEVDPKAQEASSTSVTGEPPAGDLLEVDDDGAVVLLDPRGSDLWLESRTGEDGAIRLPVSLTENQSILIAGTGEKPIPNGASIAWVQDRNTPWAGPLLAGGAAFALLGAVLYLVAFDRDKRALGPRRGRRGPLVGVQNVVGGMRRRKSADPEVPEAPKQGGLSDAPALELGESTNEAATDATDTAETNTVETDTELPEHAEETAGEEPENQDTKSGDDHAK